MQIRRYNKADEIGVFNLIHEEGDDWACYYSASEIERYNIALENSIVYIVIIDGEIGGYVRCRDDDGFGIYVYDLLVAKSYRGNNLGRKLLERVCHDYPNSIVYVMSDVDGYYKKLGFAKEGSIFIVRK